MDQASETQGHGQNFDYNVLQQVSQDLMMNLG